MRRQPTASPIQETNVVKASDSSRQQRNLAGVIAQYVQDLTREPDLASGRG